jgi:hypothetical protein
MSTDFGTDLWCIDDFDPRMPDVTGRTVAIQRMVRRLFTPRGSTPDCPNDGIDVRDFLNLGSSLTAAQIQGIIAGELQKEDACLSALVTVTFAGPLSRRTMSVVVKGELSDGPFDLVLAVSSLTVELLSAS